MDVQRRLEVAEQENDRLRARVRMLEEALIGGVDLPPEWPLTTSERRIFGVLVNRELATKTNVMVALYRDLHKDEPEIKIVDVFVCKLRRKLVPFGITIHTRWGEGYYLDAETRARFRDRAA